MYSLDTLEYYKLLEILASYAVSEPGRNKIKELKPVNNIEYIKIRFDRLKEALKLDSSGIGIVPENVNDTYSLLKKSAIVNNYLEPEELLLIDENIRSFSRLKKTIAPLVKDYPNIGAMFKNVSVPQRVADAIEKVIDHSGRLKDDASEKLIEINQRIRNLKSQIEKILQSYFTSPETKEYLQEPRITIKNDRYVIPVKHTYRNKIKGVIHAHSSSDQTVFLEPFSITEKNNEIRILEKEKEKEIIRILQNCTMEVNRSSESIRLIQDILVDMDVIQAKVRFTLEYSAVLPEFSEVRAIEIEGARHPLIRGKVVPVDFRVTDRHKAVVITGPNTGGKTVLLKTIGLFICMAQSSIPVPADSFKTMVFDSVYAEIGDEQSIEQSLSTFSAHIKNIRDIINRAGEKDLILIDELGAGTDPIEGGAIGTSILDYLRRRNILTIVTTHLSMIKMYALEHEDVLVASVQFDTKTLKPTYRVIMGIPGRSNAIEVSEILGLQKEIIDNAKKYMGEEERNFDSILKRLSDLEMNLSERKMDLDRKEKEIDTVLKSYREKSESLAEREQYFKTDFKRDVSNLLSEYRKKLEKSILEVSRRGADRAAVKEARSRLREAEKEFEKYESSVFPNSSLAEERRLKSVAVGDTVKIRTGAGKLVKGSVIELDGDRAVVRVGLLKMHVDRKDIVDVEKRANEVESDDVEYDVEADSSPPVCDIRGMRFDRAMEEVKKFLDRALLNNMERVSIIHGLGTGALREGVWEYLKKCDFVSNYHYARPEEGGFGCTIVELKR